MKVVGALDEVAPPAGGSVVTIGAYDGVHLGHRAVLEQVKALARSGGYTSVVVTFDRHPASVVRPQSAPRLLTDLDQKLDLLGASATVDLAVVVPFDQARAAEEPEDFVRSVLVNGLGARAVVVGEDFHFGRRRRGDVALLRRLGIQLDFEVVGLALVDGDFVPGGGVPGPVSSTAIRAMLVAGDVVGVAVLLGRPHEVRGTVVIGDRRGRQLGYPTANVAVPPEILLPASGIYAGWYERPGGQRHPAAISLGVRPTFDNPDASMVLEVYLLDFAGDLYGETARVRFAARLRGEIAFGSTAELIEAIAADVAATRVLLDL